MSQPLQITPGEKPTHFSYDTVGNRTQIIDPEDRVLKYTYNGRNEMTTFTDPDENVTTFRYNGVGSLSKIQRPDGVTTNYTYNENNWITKLENKGEKFYTSYQYAYDKVGNRISQTEEDGAKTTYQYDALSRLTDVRYPKEKIEKIRSANYTPPLSRKGNTVKNTDANSPVTGTVIQQGDLVNSVSTTGTNEALKGNTSLLATAQPDGQFGTIKTNPAPETNNTVTPKEETGIKAFFSKVGTAVKETFVKIGQWVKEIFASLWNGISNIFGEVVHAKLLSSTDSKDKNQKPVKEEPGNSKPDKKDQEVKKEQPEKKDEPKPDQKNENTHGIGKPKTWEDFYNQILTSAQPDYVMEPVAHVQYEYDEVGNRIKETKDGKVTNYQYNEANEMVKAGEDLFYYDANGNLVEKQSPNGNVKYQYTTDNRLQGVYYPDGSQVEYQYDALRRKVTRKEASYDVTKLKVNRGTINAIHRGNGNKNGLEKQLGEALFQEETHYLYDGTNVFKEYGEHNEPLAQYYMGAGQVLARKMFGFHHRKQESYEGNIRTRGGLMYYNDDALGNVMDITDHLGERVMSYRYDAFGNLFNNMAAPYNATGYTGKTYDAKAGLMDYGARWYSPSNGRFISEDTFTGYLGQTQSLNRYSYAQNNPMNLIDPTGRQAVADSGGGGGYTWSGEILRKGDTGQPVTDLQNLLNGAGFSPGPIDGIFGSQTESAVKGFQSHVGITVDGLAGPITYDKLIHYGSGTGNSGGSGESGGSGSSSGSTTIDHWTGQVLRLGDEGAMLQDLQTMLRNAGYSPGEIDGKFGDNTREAVINFQRAVSITVDGVAGRQTYNALRNYGNNSSISQEKPWEDDFRSKAGSIPGVKLVTINGTQYYDFSIIINKMIIDNAKIAREHRPDEIFKYSGIVGTGIYSIQIYNSLNWFHDQVNHKAPWDLKRQNRWKEQLPLLEDFDLFDSTGNWTRFVLNGEVITAEDLGNITYGFWARAMGYGDKLIYAGGGYAKIGNADDPSLYDPNQFYGDDKNDHFSIKKGIDWYNRIHRNDKPVFDPGINELKVLFHAKEFF
ncbi:peptidoglycan-binding protein [Tepidibacillus marianensis]|uniref:peptidoglycan-binding protein n=1 Tax=Tepidibacillus marianensis TaxID=3131995 RepID=UPI0030D0E6B2